MRPASAMTVLSSSTRSGRTRRPLAKMVTAEAMEEGRTTSQVHRDSSLKLDLTASAAGLLEVRGDFALAHAIEEPLVQTFRAELLLIDLLGVHIPVERRPFH